MQEIKGYTITEILYQGRRFNIYRGYKTEDRKNVVLKVCRFEQPLLNELASLQHEYHILQQLKLPGVIQVYDLIKYQQQLILVLEDMQAQSLRQYIAAQPMTLSTFFKIALQLADTLSALHLQHIVHKDINPNNILIKPETLTVKLADFSIASQLSQEIHDEAMLQNLEGTLAYLSPEQTGRMNRALDYRTDFYSLGITFYEMLTGQLPFQAADPLEIIYCHLAETPKPICEINPHIPEPVAAIIAKLMAKIPEERYTSAIGLKADLLECQLQWQTRQQIEPFVLGLHDIQDHLIISQKLYGREEQIKQLLDRFERVNQGHKEVLFISGYSGIGKTSLVKEIQTPIVRQHGYFISGKYDQLQKAVPYSALIEALQELVRHLLAEPQEKLVQLKQSLLTALGHNGQVIINIIPNIALIIGPQPLLSDLPPTEAQNRFMLTFQSFIRALAQPEHPLVLFVDDLQWADSASLQLLKLLLTDSELHYFFLIGAYRDNEVTLDHPFIITQQQLQEAGISLTKITLSSLTIADISLLLADSLNCSVEKVTLLAELLWNKTQGNPFFINEFLKKLYQDKLLVFDFEKYQWKWDIENIQQQAITDNVVDLLIGRIHQLPEKTQYILKLAACIGHIFDLQTLAIISEQTVPEVIRHLWEAVQINLVAPLGNNNYLLAEGMIANMADDLTKKITYRFSHDRIQQAAYQLIYLPQRQLTHLAIGRLLLKANLLQEQDEQLFSILNHFNQSLSLLADPTERLQIAQANLWAGKKSKAASAYELAKHYLNSGIALLTADAWSKHYLLTFALHKEAAEIAYLSGNFSQAETDFNQLLQHAKTKLEQAEIYQLYIDMLNALNRRPEALQLGLSILQELGMKIPRKPKLYHLLTALIAIKSKTAYRTVQDLNLPAITDDRLLMISKIAYQLFGITYAVDQNLFALLIFKMIYLFLNNGYTPQTPTACLSYAYTLINVFNQYQLGLDFVELSQKINSKLPASLREEYHLYFMLGGFIAQCKYPFATNLDYLMRGYHQSLEAGSIVFANYNIVFYAITIYAAGKPLSQLANAVQSARAFIDKFKVNELKYINQTLENYLNDMISDSLPGNLSQAIASINLIENYQSKTEIGFIYSCYTKLCYQTGLMSEALKMGARHEAYRKFIGGTLMEIEGMFYYALAIAATYLENKKSKKRYYLKKLKVLQAQIKRWANWCPANFLAYDLLLSAEIARLKNNTLVAINLYDEAIHAAQGSDCLPLLGTAYECTAHLYLSINKELIAKLYLQYAYYTYTQWGAAAKIKMLEQQYPGWFQTSLVSSDILSRDITATINTRAFANIDILAVMKATQAISSEIRLDKLLQTLLFILLQNAGAQRGVLLTKKNEIWVVEVEGVSASQRVNLAQAETLDKRTDLPLSLINYVQRTQELVLIQNKKELESYFGDDTYLGQVQPQSLIVLPILYQNQLSNILYLENRTTSYAFTKEHIQTLQLLASQAAISLENARLYYQATHDALTGLANRNLLYQTLKLAISKAEQTKSKIAVLFMDLDGFKKINDTLGHEVGDKLLFYFAERLKLSLGEEDLAVRLGGDEFVVILDGVAEVNQVSQMAEKFLQTIAEPVKILDYELHLSASIGISIYPDNGTNIQELLKQADAALYRVKETSKGSYQFYSVQFNEQMKQAHLQERELRHALERNELCLYYQPIFNCHNLHLSHFEALLRWRHPERGLLVAEEFITLAEKTELILPIGEWILKTVCYQIKSWLEEGIKPVPVAINISGLQFKKQMINFLVEKLLKETGIDASLLELEFTESVFIEHSDKLKEEITALKKLGVKLTIDDFGIHYSSLAYLRRFAVNKIKIDQSFVKDIEQDEEDRALILAIIAMAHSLKLKVVAEGIETKQQLAFLTEKSVDEFQGYYLSSPLDNEASTAFLKQNENLDGIS